MKPTGLHKCLHLIISSFFMPASFGQERRKVTLELQREEWHHIITFEKMVAPLSRAGDHCLPVLHLALQELSGTDLTEQAVATCKGVHLSGRVVLHAHLAVYWLLLLVPPPP